MKAIYKKSLISIEVIRTWLLIKLAKKLIKNIQ